MTASADQSPESRRSTEPTETPASHRVVVQGSWGRSIAGAVVGAVLVLLGVGGVLTAIAIPSAENRTGMFVAGPILAIVGVLCWLSARRGRRPRIFLFTASALEGPDVLGHWFRVPWTALESIEIQGWRRSSARRWFNLNLTRNSTAATLRLKFRPGVTLTEAPQAWTRFAVMPLSFWNRPELIDAMAYGCEHYAPEKFQGVTLL